MRTLRDALGEVLRAAAYLPASPMEPWTGRHYLSEPDRVGAESEAAREHWRQRADEVLSAAETVGVKIELG